MNSSIKLVLLNFSEGNNDCTKQRNLGMHIIITRTCPGVGFACTSLVVLGAQAAECHN